MSKGGGVTPLTARMVIERDSGMCVAHQMVTQLRRPVPGEQIHHRRARGMGGSTDPVANGTTNLLYLCSACHAWIESHRTWALEMGYLVRQGMDPAKVPVVHLLNRVVYLTDDGGVSQFVTSKTT